MSFILCSLKSSLSLEAERKATHTGTTILVASILEEGQVFHESRIPVEYEIEPGKGERRRRKMISGNFDFYLPFSTHQREIFAMSERPTILLFLFFKVHDTREILKGEGKGEWNDVEVGSGRREKRRG